MVQKRFQKAAAELAASRATQIRRIKYAAGATALLGVSIPIGIATHNGRTHDGSINTLDSVSARNDLDARAWD